ncbi:Poly-beta-hydroxybutyrate polymerase domain protein [Burkholderiales bacterium]|nr:Poly-beta-hydroxybutyrate polymerase domain protein [Burkholderiales bacterium]
MKDLPITGGEAVDAAAEIPPITSALDRVVSGSMSRITQGISPASIMGAYADWLVHLAAAPGKQQELINKAARKLARLSFFASRAAFGTPQPCVSPLPQDHRFDGPEWQQWPFNFIYQAFLCGQQWWHNATSDVRGVTKHHEQLVTFVTRQWIDILSPSNWPLTNPQVLRATALERGANLVRGAQFWWHDAVRLLADNAPEGAEQFRPGVEVARTPGKVVFRNHLIELIQYEAQTPTVLHAPVLIIPSWILKYYILDLSPHNSLVRYLVERGHTVFMVSWRNPGSEDRDVGMDDYLKQGVLAAVDAVSAICPQAGINSVGYCLGGTLLAMAAALMSRNGDERLQSLTLLASELDFTDPGELGLFIDASQLAYLEDLMWEKGYLDGKQMLGAFAILNSRDLLWSRMVRDYLMGVRQPLTDLAAWNADATRMPYRQHREYLERLYLNNDLAEGRYRVDGRAIALTDVQVPVFSVGTLHDAVSPWRSVYKLHLLVDSEVTFCLSSGGHNVGVVNPPEPGAQRSFQVATRAAGGHYIDPDLWLASVPVQDGSWWPYWESWLQQRAGNRETAPSVGAPQAGYPALAEAPGSYVLAQ